MAKIARSFNFGNKEDITLEKLLESVDEMYALLADAINQKPDLFEREEDGQPTDTFLPRGSLNLNTISQKVEMLTKHISPTSVTWKEL